MIPAGLRWKELQWCCVDTETTGVDVATAKIVELGAVTYYRGDVLERRGTLLNPGCPIPAEATAVHGLVDADVADQPTLEEIAERFLTLVESAQVLVAYNAPFDFAILERELGDKWRDAIADKVVIDPLVVVRFERVGRYWKGTGRHRLTNVCTRLRVPLPSKAHRATADCEMACRVLDALCKHLPDDGREAHELVAKSRAKQDAEFQAYLARMAQRQLAGVKP